MIKFLIFFLFLFCKNVLSDDEYEAVFNPLICKGVASDYQEMVIAKWKFFPTGGSGAEIDIRYNGKKKIGKLRTSVFKDGNLYGRGKWIGRTSSRIYNTLIEINYNALTKNFTLKSNFNPDEFHLMGKCK